MLQNNIGQIREGPRIGIGSWTFRYAIGFKGFKPPKPMTIFNFLSEAHRLGFGSVQLCENLNYLDFNKGKLLDIGKKAQELGLFIELGMAGLARENMLRHLEIAKLLSAKFLRVVIDAKNPLFEDKRHQLRARSIKVLEEVLPQYKEENIPIGIENHFGFSSRDLVEIIKEINDEQVGLIFDTTNHLAFIERSEETLSMFQPYLFSMHLKDFIVRKVEAGYLISGTPLGKGWLRVEEVLKSALSSGKLLSIILEMTVRRSEQQSVEEILSWERRSVEKSAKFLNETLARIKQEST